MGKKTAVSVPEREGPSEGLGPPVVPGAPDVSEGGGVRKKRTIICAVTGSGADAPASLISLGAKACPPELTLRVLDLSSAGFGAVAGKERPTNASCSPLEGVAAWACTETTSFDPAATALGRGSAKRVIDGSAARGIKKRSGGGPTLAR